MKTKLTYLLAISSLLIMGSCATSKQTAQQVDQNDDVYYSEAKAKEKAEVIAQAKPEDSRKSDYVTDEELYRDAYGNNGDYAQRIYRFRNYTPWRGYYNNIYGYNYGNMYNGYYGNMYSSYYDPYYSPYSFYGGPGINLAVDINGGFFNYNPWRYYGYNYTSNFWGPYSYYNSYGIGFGGYGNGFYGGGYGVSRPAYTSPNYRPRPTRGSNGLPVDPGAVNGGNAGGVIRNGNNPNVIQSGGGRAGRYDGATSTAPSSGNSRPVTTQPRPERVSQQPQRSSQPERVNSAPPSNNNGGGGRSDGGGSSSGGGGGGRPSRGN